MFQVWTERAERIRSSALLPEEPVGPLLAKMLVPAPYRPPEKKAKKKDKEVRSVLHREGTSDITSEDTEAHSSNEDKEEEEDAPPSGGGDKKRKAAPTGEAEGSKKGRTLLPDCSTTAADSEDEWLLKAKPLAKS